MPKLYHSHYSGWTRSKAKAIKASRDGTKEDGGGVMGDVWAYTVPDCTLNSLLSALNDSQTWPATHVASVRYGRIVPLRI